MLFGLSLEPGWFKWRIFSWVRCFARAVCVQNTKPVSDATNTRRARTMTFRKLELKFACVIPTASRTGFYQAFGG